MAEEVKVRAIYGSMIYDEPSIFLDFNDANVGTMEDDEFFQNGDYGYNLISYISYPDKKSIYGYEIVGVEDFVNDPDSLKVIGVTDTFEYEGFKGSLKEIVIKYLKDNGAITE